MEHWSDVFRKNAIKKTAMLSMVDAEKVLRIHVTCWINDVIKWYGYSM